MTDKLAAALKATGIILTRLDPSNASRQIFLKGENRAISHSTFRERVARALQPHKAAHAEIYLLALDPASAGEWEDLVVEYAEGEGLFGSKAKVSLSSDRLGGKIICADALYRTTSNKKGLFFVDQNGVVCPDDVELVAKTAGVSEQDAAAGARMVTRVYLPHGPRGFLKYTHPETGEEYEAVNIYIPPPWKSHPAFTDKKNKGQINPLIKKLIWHLFPIPKEREYVLAWIYMSLFHRAPTYLGLCGAPGAGKGRFNIVLRALHGASNVVAGKPTTLTGNFNPQLLNNTYMCFDELKFSRGVKSVMKENQNDVVSIEAKGVDSTRNTRIYVSTVIMNNADTDNDLEHSDRKFAYVTLAEKRLESSMTPKEINHISTHFDVNSPDKLDVASLAQFARWLEVNGPALAAKFLNMEYKGPKFYTICQTSISKYEMHVLRALFNPTGPGTSARFAPDPDKGYLWSKIDEPLKRTAKGNSYWHTPPTWRDFFLYFADLSGNLMFKVEDVMDGGIFDFYVKPIKKNRKTDLI